MAERPEQSALGPQGRIIDLTGTIVASYVTKNEISGTALQGLIRTIHETLQRLGSAEGADTLTTQKPFVSIKKSVTPDYLICLEDGAKLKMLKRYLRRFDLTPEQYRGKWGLPRDYPMVAANYSVARSTIAKKSGLGRSPKVRKRRKRA